MGLTEGRATTAIVNDADATVENTDWDASSKYSSKWSPSPPVPILKNEQV